MRKTLYHPYFKDWEVEAWVKAFSAEPQVLGLQSLFLDCNCITWQWLALIILTMGSASSSKLETIFRTGSLSLHPTLSG